MRCVPFAVQPYHFYNAHLQQLIHAGNLVHNRYDVCNSFRHSTVREEDECIALASRVRFCGQEGFDEFGGVGNEVLKFPVDVVDSEDCVLADVGMTVFET